MRTLYRSLYRSTMSLVHWKTYNLSSSVFPKPSDVDTFYIRPDPLIFLLQGVCVLSLTDVRHAANLRSAATSLLRGVSDFRINLWGTFKIARCYLNVYQSTIIVE